MAQVTASRALALLAALVAGDAAASGWAIDTQSAAATAQGGAVTALVDGPESVFYNPAGLVNLGGIAGQLGGTVMLPQMGYARAGKTALAERSALAPFTVFAAGNVNPNIAVGVGLYTPVAMNVHWPVDFDARFDAKATELMSLSIAPTVAYRVMPGVSVGVGIAMTKVSLLHERALDFLDAEGRLRVGGGGWVFGVNAGGQASLFESRLKLGVAFRSGAVAPIKGRADYTVPIEFAEAYPDQAAGSSADLPSHVAFSAAVVPIERLTVGAEAAVGLWGDRPDWGLDFPDNRSLNVVEPRNLKTTVAARAGAEYRLFSSVRLRAGFGYDTSPVPPEGLMPSMPDGDRIHGALGAGYRTAIGEGGRHRLAVDAAYAIVAVRTRKSTVPELPAAYAGSSHVFAVSVSYLWPR